MVARRHVGQNAEPAEGVDPLVALQHRRGNAPAADPVIAVATRDVVAFQVVQRASPAVSNEGLSVGEIVKGDLLCFEEKGSTARLMSLDEISGDLGLSVNHDGLAAREAVHVHTEMLAIKGYAEATVGQAATM